jgi:hypothetical protein
MDTTIIWSPTIAPLTLARASFPAPAFATQRFFFLASNARRLPTESKRTVWPSSRRNANLAVLLEMAHRSCLSSPPATFGEEDHAASTTIPL